MSESTSNEPFLTRSVGGTRPNPPEPDVQAFLDRPGEIGQTAEPVPPPLSESDQQLTAPDAREELPTEPETPRLTAKLPAIPGYQVLSELGRGGMGVVYKARHLRLHRLVALKMLRDGLLAGPQQLARFQSEAEAVARLRHPHIVQIHEIGEHEGRPYFSLELVEGGNLAQKLAGRPVPASPAALLVEQLARAMHYAHTQGIVHRDLKPANILLVSSGVVSGEWSRGALPTTHHSPLTTHQPKITDFGLAKQLDDEVFLSHTPSEALMGTPSYMAPEQAWGKSREVGPAADLYALGAILYELLTGRPPFLAERLLDVLDLVRSSEPVPPRRLQPSLPRDLETICLKCLQKEPRKRYATAEALAEDLRRFREGESITARRTPAWERAVKWSRRRPALAALLAVSSCAAVLLAVVLGIGYVQSVEATLRQEQLAGDRQRMEAELKKQEQATEDAKRREAEKEQERLRIEEQLDQQRAAQRKAEEDRTKNDQQAQQQVAELQKQALKERELAYYQRIHQAERALVQNDVAGARQYLTECVEALRSWEWDYLSQLCRGRGVVTFPGRTGPITSVAFSSDGTRLALAAGKSTSILETAPGQNVHRGRTLDQFADTVHKLAFSPDGRFLASASLGWTGPPPKKELPVQDGRPRASEVAAAGPFPVFLAEAPMPEQKASPRQTGEVKLWDVAKGKCLFFLARPDRVFTDVAFSPDGKQLATASLRWVRVEKIPPKDQKGALDGWIPAAAAEVRTLPGTGAFFTALADRLVLVEVDEKPSVDPVRWEERGEVILWDAATGKELFALPVKDRRVTSVAFSSDGQRLASAAGDGAVTIWDLAKLTPSRPLRGHRGEVTAIAFSPDSQYFATAGKDETVRIWEMKTEAVVVVLDKHTSEVTGVAFHPNGKRLATSSGDRTVKLWDARTGQEVLTLRGSASRCLDVRFSADGRRLTSASGDGTVKMWATGPLPEPPEPLPVPPKPPEQPLEKPLQKADK